MNKPFEYKVNLIPLKIKNEERIKFMEKLLSIPYLLYEVEQLKNGDKIVINKPGGKRNFKRLARNDFMVFIYKPSNGSLWLISHDEIKSDLQDKYNIAPKDTKEIINGLYKVYQGQEPDDVLDTLKAKIDTGLSPEIIYKVYKWIWGQEDCNYPTGAGRSLSMNGILEHFEMKNNLE
jgi:hypothetical protein